MTPSIRRFLSPKTAPASRAPRRPRLGALTLESREVPATFAVPAQYATIQAALNAAAASGGSDTVVVSPGTYTEALTINDASAVTLKKSSGTVTVQSPAAVAANAALIDILSRNVTVDGLTVDGATNTDGDLFAGIRVIDNGSATIKNNSVTGLLNSTNPVGNIGIQIGTHTLAGALGAGTAKVTNNTVTNYVGAGVLVDGAGAEATVKSNTITGRGAANGAVVQYGVQVSRGATARVESNIVTGNTVADAATTSAGIYFFQAGGRDNVAAKNKANGNAIGIMAEQSDGTACDRLQIVNNTVKDSTGFAGIYVTDSDNVEVKNNAVNDNESSTGIAVTVSNSVKVQNNQIKNNGLADGIYLFDADGNSIKCNEVEFNGYNGIYAEDSSNNSFWNNETAGNGTAPDATATYGGNGVYVFGGQCNDIWLGESAANTDDGIRLENTTGNTIIANHITCNTGYGVQLINADNSFIFLNCITGNGAGSIYVDAASTGTVEIANRTDTPPVVEGDAGDEGTSAAFAGSAADADAATAELED